MPVGQLGAHVDDLDKRQLADRPRREGDPVVRPITRAPDGLDRRRRGPEDTGSAGQLGELDRGVPGLESGRPVALVRRIVLLVDDDDAQIA